MHAILYNEKFFIQNYPHVDDDDELYLNYDWSSDTLSLKSNMSGSNLMDFDGNGERLSLAYEKLTQIPRKIAEKFSRTTTILDLSYNNFKDLSFLSHFRHLNTLILDHNELPDEKSFPSLPNLEVLWLNHCGIQNIQDWLYRIRDCCPQLKQLSLMANPGAMSSFNGNSSIENNDYRMLVISILPHLRHLDDTLVSGSQRTQARQYKTSYNLGATPFNIFESVGRARQQQQQQQTKRASLRRRRLRDAATVPAPDEDSN